MASQIKLSDAQSVQWLLTRLLECYGPQYWWPADSAFEIMLGAILTQNAAWINVIKAINQLKIANCLTLDCIIALSKSELAALIQPAGYYNVKAQRIHNLCQFLLESGDFSTLQQWETSKLRSALLQVNGIGLETADDILLYAFDRPVFVVDTYTRRIGSRLGLFKQQAPYEIIRAFFEAALGECSANMNELHALLVQHAKQSCHKVPQCSKCCLKSACIYSTI